MSDGILHHEARDEAFFDGTVSAAQRRAAAEQEAAPARADIPRPDAMVERAGSGAVIADGIVVTFDSDTPRPDVETPSDRLSRIYGGRT